MSLEALRTLANYLGYARLSAWVKASFWRQVALLFLLSLIVLFFGLWVGKSGVSGFYDFYDAKLRGYLFSGFLSTGAFLMSLKAFIVANMKTHVYDTDWYQEKFRERRSLSPTQKIDKKSLYLPLFRLSEFIHWSIVFSIVTAAAQFSLGLIESCWVSVFCVWLGLFSLFLLLNSLRLLRNNVRVWLRHSNE